MDKEYLVVEVSEECPYCEGTGIYVGLAERDGYGVVCYQCNGTGEKITRHTYKPFRQRKIKDGVDTVMQRGTHYVAGKIDGEGNKLNFGGIPYKDWLNGAEFTKGTEPREYVCPLMWTGQEWHPHFCISMAGMYIPNCKMDKAKCWEEYDKYFYPEE